MRRAYLVDDVRAAEAATGSAFADGTLMQRAAAALAALVADLLDGVYGAEVVVLAGSGDNGGDALFAGAALARRGARVRAVRTAQRSHVAATEALIAAGGRVLALDDDGVPAVLASADVVLDGVVGIGGRGSLHPSVAAVLAHVGPEAFVVAVDLPSGVDADTGAVDGAAVVADITLCFGALKPAALVDPGARCAGLVLSVDIGLAPYLPDEPAVETLDPADVAELLRRPDAGDDKYSRGVVGVVAGSDQYPGAAVLTVAGAYGGGAGMVRALAGPTVAAGLRSRWPEAIVVTPSDAGAAALGRVQSWVVGPGAGTDAAAAALLEQVLGTDEPVVIDADGLTVVASRPELAELLRRREAPTVLTPHAGELARLLDTERHAVEARPLEHVRAAAARFGATVLLKGSVSLVADAAPSSPVRANPRATAWLSTAGTGDVLAGVVGALLAAGLSPRDAASAAAVLHARAAEIASDGGPLRAGDVAVAVPRVVADLLDPRRASDSTP